MLLSTLQIIKNFSKRGLNPEGTIGKEMEILENFRENRLEELLWRKLRLTTFHKYKGQGKAGKIKKPACKILRVWNKNEENFEIFKKI